MIQTHPYLFYSLLVIALVITRIPIISKFFKGLDTLIHECGHAIVALLVQGEVISIELYSDTSGVAVTRTSNKFKQFLVSIAGYPFSSLMGFVFFYLIKHDQITLLLFIFASLSIITLILWIRNWYGFFWLLIFLTIIGLTHVYGTNLIKWAVSIFLVSMMVFDSIAKSFIVLYLSLKSPRNAGDAYNLKQITYIPAFIWGLLFVCISFICLYFTYLLFFKLPIGL